eukprot:jgi/Mesen1/7314/ME000376S06489
MKSAFHIATFETNVPRASCTLGSLFRVPAIVQATPPRIRLDSNRLFDYTRERDIERVLDQKKRRQGLPGGICTQSSFQPFEPSQRNRMALRHIPSKGLHVSTPTWWLESRFHFSFAEYYNPSNSEFGVLRVLNDDLVKPHSGFGTHPHRDMEIVTYVVDGQLTHKDSTGTMESLGRGSVQYMSAGRGITHSEMNAGNDLLRFLQLWIKPAKKGLTPNYGSRVFTKAERHNRMQHVVTSFAHTGSGADSGRGVIPVHQDANIFVSEMDAGFQQEYTLQRGRQAYLVCIEGSVSVNDTTQLRARDALEASAPKGVNFPLKFKADGSQGAHILLVEMAQEGSGVALF